jgi:hypothetical protein
VPLAENLNLFASSMALLWQNLQLFSVNSVVKRFCPNTTIAKSNIVYFNFVSGYQFMIAAAPTRPEFLLPYMVEDGNCLPTISRAAFQSKPEFFNLTKLASLKSIWRLSYLFPMFRRGNPRKKAAPVPKLDFSTRRLLLMLSFMKIWDRKLIYELRLWQLTQFSIPSN